MSELSHNSNRQPAIRFKGFTDPWEQRKLKNTVEVSSGRDYKHLNSGNIPVYGTGGHMLDVDNALSYTDDAVGIGRKGTIDKPYILKAPFWTVDTLFYCIPRKKFDLDFIFAVFQRINWKSKDESTGVPSLSKNTINSVLVMVPSYGEQVKIGFVFEQLDNLIALHQRKVEVLQNLKKALLQRMFASKDNPIPDIRFAGFTDPWEQRKFEDIVTRLNKASDSNQLPKIEFEDIISGEGQLNKDVSNKLDNRKGTLFYPKNILYGKLRPYLKNWLFATFEGIALGDFWVLKTNHTVPEFVYTLIQSDSYQKVANDTSGTKMPRSDWKKVSATYFSIPQTIDEQEYIGIFFKRIDTTIALHQRKAEVLQDLKKALLQKMFI